MRRFMAVAASLVLCAFIYGRCCFAEAAPSPEFAEPATALSYDPLLAVRSPVLLAARQTLRTMVAGFYASAASRFAFLPASQESMVASLDAIPVIGTLRRRAGRRFNTDDGSSVDDFAICYRLSPRLGLQVIPGDPAPVKLAVTSVANNAGVTVGMTWRLSRR